MDGRRRSIILLEQADWGEDTPRIEGLKRWRYYPMTLEALQNLNVDVLYKSAVHGSGHINRVLLMAALIACREELEGDFLRQYYMAASYHDIGRTFDGLDLDHGTRSAQQLAALVDYRGDPLRQLQGAVAAHSQPDARMEEMIAEYQPLDAERARSLARLLKDADNLDRVRLGDLKPEFLRHESAKDLEGFSRRLLHLDQQWKKKVGT